MDKIPVQRVRKAMEDYKEARRNIFKSLSSIVQNLERMDRTFVTIKHSLTVESSKEERSNVFTKIFQTLRIRSSSVLPKK